MKKLLVLLLSVLMLALLSVTASAAVEVNSIEVMNLRAPLAGNVPDFDVELYSAVEAYELPAYNSINGIMWYRVDKLSGSSKEIETQLSKNDTFELGKKYRVRISVKPIENRQWADTVYATVKELDSDALDAKSASVVTPTGNGKTDHKVVAYTFECTKSSIDSVKITGLKLPKLGEHPDDDCNVLTEGVYVSNADGKVQWLYDGRTMNPATDVFEAGKTYKLVLWLRTEFEDGFWFRTDALGENVAEVVINGITYDVCDTYEYDHIRNVEYDYYVPYNIVDEFGIVDADAPVAGKVPDFELFTTTSGYDISDVQWLDVTYYDELFGDGNNGISHSEAFKKSVLTKENGKVFQEGHIYRLYVDVTAQDSYQIKYDAEDDYLPLEFTATINGNEAQTYSSHHGEPASFSYTFAHTCTYKLVKKVPATCEKAGKEAYYKCPCGKLSEDATGEKPFVDGGLWGLIPATGHSFTEKIIDKAHLVSAATGTIPAVYKYDCANCNAISPDLTFKHGNKLGVFGNPTKISATPTSNSIKLTWAAVDGANIYRVYQKNGSTWKTLGDVAKLDGTIKSLKAGTKYTFAVKAGAKIGDKLIWAKNYATIDTATKTVKPSKVTATQSTSQIKLSWPKVSGASGYRIFVKSGSSWNVIVSATTATSYTVKSLKAGTKYTYAVRPYVQTNSGVVWSDYTECATATKAVKPSKVTAKQTANTITLNWTKCSGATGYRIYYKSGSAWKVAVSSTAATTHTFKNLKAGAKYTFAVRPYIKNGSTVIWSDYTTYTAATNPATVTAKASSPSKGKISLSWNAVNGADGYQVYYKTGNGSYKLYKTVGSGTKSLSFSNLKSGTKYTFAVRAGIKTSGGNIFGGYKAATVSVK